MCIFLGAVVLLGCNKEQRFSDRLQKGEVWDVSEISISGENTNLFGTWTINSEVDISEAVPDLTWITSNLGQTSLKWQFQNKGKKIQLNYNQDCVNCTSLTLDSLDFVAHNLTGNYTVERKNRKRMQFSSNTTIGYPNQTVVIEIERQ